MGLELSKHDLGFVRWAAKGIVSRLLPDELPFFDIVWRALEPVLPEVVRQPGAESGYPEIVAERLGGQGFAAKWLPNADLLEASVVLVLGRSLAEAREHGLCSEDQIGEIVARQSLRWPLPGSLLRVVQRSVADFCGGLSTHGAETGLLFTANGTPVAHQVCYFVFHDGSDNFYEDALPREVLQLRERVLFWIHRAAGDFCSRGRPRPKGLGPQAESVLRFLCHERNAGKTVPLMDLFSSVWVKRSGSRPQNPVASVRVEVSKLNAFADVPFESERGDAMVRYSRETAAYTIHARTPTECCIVRPVSSSA